MPHNYSPIDNDGPSSTNNIYIMNNDEYVLANYNILLYLGN